MIVPQQTSILPAEQFTSELSSVCGNYDFRMNSGRSRVWGGVSRLERDDWDVALISTDMDSAVKTPSNIRRDDVEYIFLILQQYGQSIMDQNDRQVRLLPGDMMLVDSVRPSEFTFSGERSMQVSLHLPRDLVIARCGDDVVNGRALRGSDLTSRAIHSLIQQICSEGEDATKSAMQREVLFGLLQLFRHECRQDHTQAAPAADELVFARAEQMIAAEFRDPFLTGERIAHRIGVSLRKLQRAYSSRNTTLTHAILTARLEFAKNLLTAPDRDAKLARISSLALHAGFSDISYFNRRFREAYGCSPKEFQQSLL